MSTHYLTYSRVVRDQYGKRYLDITSDALDDAGLVVLVPLEVLDKPKNNVASSVNNDNTAVTTMTANDLRDVLSEAEAILADSSDSSTERREFASSSMNASSSESVAGVKSSSSSKSDAVKTFMRDESTSSSNAKSIVLLLLVNVMFFAFGLLLGVMGKF